MSDKVYLYKIFSGEELKIAELIQRRRLQMLVHSYMYYKMDESIIDDYTWSMWAVELVKLQKDYPEIEKAVPFRDGFESWDGSTGAFLPLDKPWIKKKAYYLLDKRMEIPQIVPLPPKPTKKAVLSARKKLF